MSVRREIQDFIGMLMAADEADPNGPHAILVRDPQLELMPQFNLFGPYPTVVEAIQRADELRAGFAKSDLADMEVTVLALRPPSEIGK